jgi:putative transposase
MPRKARVIVPNCPHHIVQRGHNRNAVFISDQDYAYYLENLIEAKRDFGIKVYAYCLMTNHVHLVVDPGNEIASISYLMKRLAARQTRYVNKLERRTGSLWEGRYKVSPIETDSYLLACCRYVELNPVKAGMVESPEDYRWSSYRSKVEGVQQWLDIDPCYQALATSLLKCGEAYRSFVKSPSSSSVEKVIQQAIQRNQLTGSNRFVDEIEQRIGVRVEFRNMGRPVSKSIKIGSMDREK